MKKKNGEMTPPRSGSRPGEKRASGFTLIELSIVIVIIGIILSAGTLGWNAVTEGRKLAKARSTLSQVRNCLVRRMFYNNTYPSYTDGGDPSNVGTNVDCVTGGGRTDISAEDVDACLCDVRDPWGQRVFYVEGVAEDPAGEALSIGTKYTSDNEAQNVNATTPDPTASTLVDLNGNDVNYLVFVLISAGKDGLLDDSSYRDLFDGGAAPTSITNIQGLAAPMNTASPPNFDRNVLPDYTVGWTIQGDDDIYLYLTAPELRTLLAD